MKLAEHPTVRRLKQRRKASDAGRPASVDAEWLRQIAFAAGADDVGFVELARPALDDQRADILRYFPRAKALVSYVVRMSREPIRSPARSIANNEFHHTGEEVDEVGRAMVAALEERGVGAISPSMGFPMEMDRFPGKLWVVSHKPIAVAAGLGQMGIHRNVIHPKFGNFILLGTVVIDVAISEYSQPIDYNPCLECKLCVAACPVGAISADGHFDFSACYSHNYREFMGGFTDWTEQVAASRSAHDYRKRVSDAESASMWQSLSYGANYKAAYCLAVCPAGEDVIGPYLESKSTHLQQTVRPLQAREETLYVLGNSDAADHAARRFPHKTTKRVGNSLRPRSIEQFLYGLPLVFQRGKSTDLDAAYHFTFTGDDDAPNGERSVTITIHNRSVRIEDGHVGRANLHVTADAATWLGFLAGERSLMWALLRRKIRFRGNLGWLVRFGKCFPR